MTAATWWRVGRWAWKWGPWLLSAGLLVVLWWSSPAPGPTEVGGPVIISGKEALTRPAEEWKQPPPAECTPAPGGGAPFRAVTREPDAAERARLAREYGFTFAQGLSASSIGALEGQGQAGGAGAAGGDQAPAVDDPAAIARLFGEYAAPRMRYGGKYVAGLRADGEFEARFDPRSAPRFDLPFVWGAGASYDVTAPAGELAAAWGGDRASVYAFVEPVAVLGASLRVEGGAEALPSGWSEFLRVRAEWRSEPADVLEKVRERFRGLRRSRGDS